MVIHCFGVSLSDSSSTIAIININIIYFIDRWENKNNNNNSCYNDNIIKEQVAFTADTVSTGTGQYIIQQREG